MKLSTTHAQMINGASHQAQPHVCTPETCPEDGHYYVSAKDGSDWWLMAGPYATHAAALADRDRALEIANRHDGRAWFMSWGTCHVEGHSEPGNLNKHNLM